VNGYHQEWLESRLSVNEAMVIAGLRKKLTPIERMQKDFDRLSKEDVEKFLAWAMSRYQNL
jgi:uncharacterized protein (DUF433 family)